MAEIHHFLDLDRMDREVLRHILHLAEAYKRGERRDRPLKGRTLAMIFEKPSTRTRVSFEVGMRQLGGEAIVLEHHDTQLGRGETLADTARVLSRYVDAIMFRTSSHAKLEELAAHASVPVINGLTDRTHPCQLMADIMTFEEHRGPIEAKVVAWSGDVNNMTRTWIQAAGRFRFSLRVACPPALQPEQELLARARADGGEVMVTHDAAEAVKGADCVVTDTWLSMNMTPSAERVEMLAPYRVDERLMSLAKPDAIFMHCLPAHRGEEVTDGVIDGPASVVWDEAENRLHAQKGILTWCLS